jgi:glycosyltransferase involved in cell wall biosynthesis
MARAFPGAPIYVGAYAPTATYPEFADLDVRVVAGKWLRRVLSRDHRLGLLLYPFLFRRLRLDCGVALISTSGFAHGISGQAARLVYCHNPARWLYQGEEYGVPWPRVTAPLWAVMRWWDAKMAAEATEYLVNSSTVAARVNATYRRSAEVLVPPPGLQAEGERCRIPGLPSEFDLVVSRLLPYKGVRRLLQAYRASGAGSLIIVGDGPERDAVYGELRESDFLLSTVSDAQLRWLYSAARYVWGPAHEDLGLTILEAAQFGTPVIARRLGGYLDTVAEGVSGIFIDNIDPESIAESLDQAQRTKWDPAAIRKHAVQFSDARFRSKLREVVGRAEAHGKKGYGEMPNVAHQSGDSI